VIYKPADNEVRAERRRRYLADWPMDKQLEAYSESAAGRPEKLNRMIEDFAEIRKVLPFFQEGE
jgi:hypothetical protein